MKQLLILAVESADTIDIDHISLHVPRLIQGARAYGVILDKPTGATVKTAAKDCMDRLDTEQNVPVRAEPSKAEYIMFGLNELASLIPTLVGHDELLGMQKRG